jgi:hypothetical protein
MCESYIKYKVVVIGDKDLEVGNYYKIFKGVLETHNLHYTIREKDGKTHYFPINLTIIYEL